MREPAPLVSIVTPVFNGATLITETVESVLSQTYDNWELLIVDDGSTDHTREVVADLVTEGRGRIQLLRHTSGANRGACMSRIMGCESARGTFVALLDADDVWEADYPVKSVEHWQALDGANVAMSFGPVRFWHPSEPERDFEQPTPSVGVHPAGSLLREWLANGYETTPCPSALLLRRDVYPQLKAFAADAQRAGAHEDQFLYWFVGSRWSIDVRAGAWTKYRQHAASALATRTDKRTLQNERRFLEAIRPDLVQVRPMDLELHSDVTRRINYLRHSLSRARRARLRLGKMRRRFRERA